MDKYDYITAILDDLRGTTGLDFQFKMEKVLSCYYEAHGKTFEMPSPYGGDYKNDGWVVEDAIFYQFYAPQPKEMLGKDIRNKFESDLKGLVEKINKGKWGGKINKFIFIANTIDLPLPKDPDRFYENVVKKVQAQSGLKFDFEVNNLDYLRRNLKQMGLERLKEITAHLKVKSLIPINEITEKLLLDLIETIDKNLGEKTIGRQVPGGYERKSTLEKIHINDLDDRRKEIEACIEHLDVVESAARIINQDLEFSNKFERVIGLVILKYRALVGKYKGVELLDNLCVEIQKYSPYLGHTQTPTLLLVIYIFDKCDIFEMEEGG